MIDYQEELEQYKERIDELATQKRYAELRDLFRPAAADAPPSPGTTLVAPPSGPVAPLLYSPER